LVSDVNRPIKIIGEIGERKVCGYKSNSERKMENKKFVIYAFH